MWPSGIGVDNRPAALDFKVPVAKFASEAIDSSEDGGIIQLFYRG